eukprot:GDKJ01052245.1.p1 GENE.GDKJ01052245.1~~GDKJ01052245.1.p1  ORF type:complete len:395 (+),score=19.40 GDKJ01052245.1:23-1186(+)
MEILTSVLKHFKVTMGLVGLSVTGRWISKAAAKGNYQYFRLLLSQDGIAEALQHYQLQSKMAPITDIVTSAVGALKDRLEKFEGSNPKAGATSSSSSVQGGGSGLTRTASTLHVVIAKSYVKVLLLMLSDMKEVLGYSKHSADDKLKAQWQLLAFTVFHSSHKSVLARVGIAEVNGGQQVNLNAQGKIAISGFQKGGTAAASDSKHFTPPDLCSLLVAEIASGSIHADFTVSEDPASHLTILSRACFEGNAPLIAYLLEAKAGLVLKASNTAKKGNQPPSPLNNVASDGNTALGAAVAGDYLRDEEAIVSSIKALLEGAKRLSAALKQSPPPLQIQQASAVAGDRPPAPQSYAIDVDMGIPKYGGQSALQLAEGQELEDVCRALAVA